MNNSVPGFTLIELSIVLVIIGLIVGGVLVGQDLIRSAAVRAQISQIEKFNTAANTFFGKYGYLPGDIPAGPAVQYGFAARGANPGQGDGNGRLEGSNGGSGSAVYQSEGETLMFWADLSQVNLIDGTFNQSSSTSAIAAPNVGNVSNYLPAAKIGHGNFVNVWSGGYGLFNNGAASTSDGRNYFGLSVVGALNFDAYSQVGLTAQEAYSIDSKIDDGLPQAGGVMAIYLNANIDGNHSVWAAGGGALGANNNHLPTTLATASSATTCYDNGGVAGHQNYSVAKNGGMGVNCALSFQMQSGD